MVFSYCKCSYHLAGNENAAANFYNTHFVPDGWELVYSKLSECRSIHLKGRCKDCYGDLNEMIPLPEGLSGDALFQAIYDAMWSAHPYDAILEHMSILRIIAGSIAVTALKRTNSRPGTSQNLSTERRSTAAEKYC